MVALTDCCIPQGASDEFMLYSFKVLPCTRKGAHSWTECAFTHAGEKAARRCPKTHIYSAEACPDARKSGKCARGDLCPYSHGVFEQWLHPSRYRTQLCSFGTACRRPVCFFAHTVQELRVPTSCGPNPTAISASPMQASAAAAAAAAQMGLDPATAAAAAAAAAQLKDADTYAALMQQALLAQMTAATHQQLDGATATMINRYQAASCAALANAAACQRQQQQHQAAAAAAAAAAMAAAANNPASLLHMAQAAQAYQAAAAAAAAAAANMHMPHNMQGAAAAAAAAAAASANASALMSPIGNNMSLGSSLSNASRMMGSSCRSSGSNVSSPTCSSQNNGSLMSASTYMAEGSSASDPATQLPITSQAAGALVDNLLLQQALASSAACNNTWANGTTASPFGAAGAAFNTPSSSSSAAGGAAFGLPWLPSNSESLACGAYPSSLMPMTPAIADGMQNAVSTAELARQLSLQQGF